jgi:hypothetical protein
MEEMFLLNVGHDQSMVNDEATRLRRNIPSRTSATNHLIGMNSKISPNVVQI